ncbi:rhodanese-related sulfurtransferase [Oxalobacteraceae bacterium GrIS 2.11]
MTIRTCAQDVYHVLSNNEQNFVLLDVRGPDQFRARHIPATVNLPHEKIVATKMAD